MPDPSSTVAGGDP
ncbi:hypothetical protein AZE42_14197, partial [Rhizopogon vesiculosus]